jgi:hypothetical protein
MKQPRAFLVLLALLSLLCASVALADKEESEKPEKPEKEEEALISNVDDLRLGTWPGHGKLQGSDDICVYIKDHDGRYGIIMRGSGRGGRFTLLNGAHSLRYKAYYNDSKRIHGRVRMQPGRQLSSQTGASSSKDCKGFKKLNANISVLIPGAALGKAKYGTYTGTLTIILTPE